MNLEELQKRKKQLYQIAAKYGISAIYVFGSLIREKRLEIKRALLKII